MFVCLFKAHRTVLPLAFHERFFTFLSHTHTHNSANVGPCVHDNKAGVYKFAAVSLLDDNKTLLISLVRRADSRSWQLRVNCDNSLLANTVSASLKAALSQ